MNTKHIQPASLLLADALEEAAVHIINERAFLDLNGTEVAEKASAELRRLHEENESLKSWNKDEIKRLKDLLGKANALCRIRQNKIKELEEVLREMQDWEALAADQALTISLLRSEQKPEYWQEEARRYAQNADFWRQKYESVTVQRTRRVV